MDTVEECRQVNLHHDTQTVRHLLLCDEYGITHTTAGSKPMTVFTQARIDQRLQPLQKCLLD